MPVRQEGFQRHGHTLNMRSVISDDAWCLQWGCRLTSSNCLLGVGVLNWAWLLECAGNGLGVCVFIWCMCVELWKVKLLPAMSARCWCTNNLKVLIKPFIKVYSTDFVLSSSKVERRVINPFNKNSFWPCILSIYVCCSCLTVPNHHFAR